MGKLRIGIFNASIIKVHGLRHRILVPLVVVAALLSFISTDNVAALDTISAVDTAGFIGTGTSLALDSAGNPVVSYRAGGLRVVHCNDPSCTGGNESIVSVDTVNINTETSLALDGSGNPVVAYHDLTNDNLKVVHCNDPNCAGGNESIAVVDTTRNARDGNFLGSFFSGMSLNLDTNGFPVISYVDLYEESCPACPNGRRLDGFLKVAHCNDPNCAGGNESISAVDGGGDVGGKSSLVLDSLGNPVVSYSGLFPPDTSGNLRVLHCNDANCVNGDESIRVVDPASTGFSSLELDSNGNPVVSYLAFGDLKVLHCSDPNCAVRNIETVDVIGVVGWYTSLELDTSGNPVVSYYDVSNGDLKLMHCNDPNCSGRSIVAVDTTGAVGLWTSLELDISGNPVVSYHDQTNGDLKLLHCDDPNCLSGLPPIPAGLTVTGARGTLPDGRALAHNGDVLEWKCSTGGSNADIRLRGVGSGEFDVLFSNTSVAVHRARLSVFLTTVNCFVNGEFFDSIRVARALVDPSGTISDTNGIPIPGATVVLEHNPGAGFVPVDPSLGSPVIDPSINPQLTSLEGRYGWDVEPGQYRVVVEKDGCAPQTSPSVVVPPPVTDLDLQLSCTDADNDGIPDFLEVLLGLNPSLADTDGNGVQDGEEDPDGDGLTTTEELLMVTNPLISDSDNDGFNDGIDNCALDINPGQADLDEDGVGNPCDPENTVQIDIKPGSDPNCFNSDGHGVIPVAILSTDSFDATTVDPASISLDGQSVRIKGNGATQSSVEDSNGDGAPDLVVKIEDVDGTYLQGTGIATLTGETFEGIPVVGADTICITQ